MKSLQSIICILFFLVSVKYALDETKRQTESKCNLWVSIGLLCIVKAQTGGKIQQLR